MSADLPPSRDAHIPTPDAGRRDWEQQNLQGLDVLTALGAVYADPLVRTLIADVVTVTYGRVFGEQGRHFSRGVLDGLVHAPTWDPEDVADTLLRQRTLFLQTAMADHYRTSYRERNLGSTVDLCGPAAFRGTVLDVGCDDNALGAVLMQRCPDLTGVLGVDVHASADLDPSVEFRLMAGDGSLPCHDGEIDTLVIRYALHHMTSRRQVEILREARRVLAADGSVLVLENAYSSRLCPSMPDESRLLPRVRELWQLGRLPLLLMGMDTFSLAIKDKRGPYPATFRSAEQWLQLFSSCGFAAEVDFAGYPLQDLHQAPLTKYVCRPA